MFSDVGKWYAGVLGSKRAKRPAKRKTRKNPSVRESPFVVTQFRDGKVVGREQRYAADVDEAVYNLLSGERLAESAVRIRPFGTGRTVHAGSREWVVKPDRTRENPAHCDSPRAMTSCLSGPPRGEVPPPSVRRIWKAVEEAPKSERLRVARAFSRGRLLAALSWNDPDGEFDRLDRETLAEIMANEVDVGGGEVSDIGLRRPRKNPRRRSKYPLFVVQTIEVPKSYSAADHKYFINPAQARAIAERNGARKGGKIDESKNYWRFRQVDPSKMTKRYVSLKLSNAIIVKALPKATARKAKVSDSTKPLTQAELKRLWALQDSMKKTRVVGYVSTKMPPMKKATRSPTKTRSSAKKSRSNPREFHWEDIREHKIRGTATKLSIAKTKALAYAKKHGTFVEVAEVVDHREYTLGMWRNDDNGRGWVWSRT